MACTGQVLGCVFISVLVVTIVSASSIASNGCFLAALMRICLGQATACGHFSEVPVNGTI